MRALHVWTVSIALAIGTLATPVFADQLDAGASDAGVGAADGAGAADASADTQQGNSPTNVAADCVGLSAQQCDCRTTLFRIVRAHPDQTWALAELNEQNDSGANNACGNLANLLSRVPLIPEWRAAALRALGTSVAAPDAEPVGELTVPAPQADAGTPVESVLERAALIASLPDEASGASAANTTLAAPSVEPVQFASESAYLSMTRSGPRLIFAASINPMALLFPTREGVLRRLLDLTVTAPVNTQQLFAGSSMTGALPAPWNVLEFVGVRVRLNFLGGMPDNGTSSTRFAQMVDTIQSTSDSLVAAVPRWENIPRETALYLLGHADSPAQAWIDYVRELDERRRLAPRQYFGADLRWDGGNPNFATGADVLAHTLMFSFAGGYTTGGATVNVGFRARAGGQARIAIPVGGTMAENRFYADFAASLFIARAAPWLGTGAAQKMTLNVGVEGRANAGCTNMRADGTDCALDLRFSVNVPIRNGDSIGVGVAVPVINGGAVLLSFSGNIAQLLGLSDPIPVGSIRPAIAQ